MPKNKPYPGESPEEFSRRQAKQDKPVKPSKLAKKATKPKKK